MSLSTTTGRDCFKFGRGFCRNTVLSGLILTPGLLQICKQLKEVDLHTATIWKYRNLAKGSSSLAPVDRTGGVKGEAFTYLATVNSLQNTPARLFYKLQILMMLVNSAVLLYNFIFRAL